MKVLLFYRDYRMGLVPKYILYAVDMLLCIDDRSVVLAAYDAGVA